MAILDPRVQTKPYGRLFLESLPDCRTIYRFLNEGGGESIYPGDSANDFELHITRSVTAFCMRRRKPLRQRFRSSGGLQPTFVVLSVAATWAEAHATIVESNVMTASRLRLLMQKAGERGGATERRAPSLTHSGDKGHCHESRATHAASLSTGGEQSSLAAKCASF